MRRIYAVVLAVATLATPLRAQTVFFSADLHSLGASDALPVDDDGDPDTLAWLLTLNPGPAATADRRQLVVSTPGGPCFEAPFTIPNYGPETVVTVVREGRRDMLKVASKVRTVTLGSEGQWVFGVPAYTPIQLNRQLCKGR